MTRQCVWLVLTILLSASLPAGIIAAAGQARAQGTAAGSPPSPPPIPDPRVKDMQWTETSFPLPLPGRGSPKFSSACKPLNKGAPYRICVGDGRSRTGGLLIYYTIGAFSCPPPQGTVHFITASHDPNPPIECDKRAYDLSVELLTRLGAEGIRQGAPITETQNPPMQVGEVAEPEPTKVGLHTLPHSGQSANCSIGQPGCASLAGPFTPITANVAADSETFCSFGTADPTAVAFVPTDEFGNLTFPPIEIGDAPRPAGDGGSSELPPAPPSDPKTPEAPTQAAGTPRSADIKGNVTGEAGVDIMTGGPGDTSFFFRTNTDNPDDRLSGVTLDDGDRIIDYEPFEKIWIEGAQLRPENIQVHYDSEKNETRVQIHFDTNVREPGYTGPKVPHANPDRTIILNGKIEGRVFVKIDCCSGGNSTTFIQIGEGNVPVYVPKEDSQQSGGSEQSGGSQQSGDGTAPRTPGQPETPTPAGGHKSAQPERSAPVEKTDSGVLLTPGAKAPAETPASLEFAGSIVIRFKATQSALQAGSQVSQIAGERLKLTALQEQPLPNTGTAIKAEQDKGFDKSPVTCTTGADGACAAQLAAEERQIYGFPANGSRHYLAQLDLRKPSGGVIRKTAAAAKVTRPATPAGALVTERDFRIGNQSFARVEILASDTIVAELMVAYSKAFGDLFQIDYCIIIEPGPPLGTAPALLGATNPELPQTTIKLPRIAGRNAL